MFTYVNQIVPRIAVVAAFVFMVIGCRSGQQPLTSPLAVDRVPAPATRALPPGSALPYYSGDQIPAAQPFATPAPAFGQAQPPAFGQVQPPAFGQVQSPVIQAQPFKSTPQTFAQPQPFGQAQPFTPGQTLPSVAPPAQPFTPAPFTPPAVPQGSGARFAPAPNGLQTASAEPQPLFDDGAAIAIPSDDQTVRPVVAQQLLSPTQFQPQRQFQQQASPVRFTPSALPGTLPPTNHVAATLTPLSQPASPAGAAQTGTQPSPQFSALPNAANLPWISGSAPRGVTPPSIQTPVVQTAALSQPSAVAPAPRVRLPGGGAQF